MSKSNKLFLFILAVISLYCLFSCQSAEKLTYRGLAKDKGKVIDIVRKLSPCITTDSTEIVEVIVSGPDSSQFYKDKADSLGRVKRAYKDSISIRYKDSCRSVKDNYENGFNLGYELGKYDELQRRRDSTKWINTKYYVKDMGEVDICNALRDEAEKDAKKWERWAHIFGWSSAVLALLAFFIYKSKR